MDELDIEINGAATGLRVHSFSPSTQLASDLSKEIETTTTTKKEHSFGATLGGALPVPHANVVAQVSPSINANTSSCETVTEKLNRLPPKYAVVVSGTSSDGRGVFFKLKRSSQTSLEGVHELTVVFIRRPNGEAARCAWFAAPSVHGKCYGLSSQRRSDEQQAPCSST